ncbi:MAG: tetratricopeptide repeat protein [Chlamydiota bacterium]
MTRMTLRPAALLLLLACCLAGAAFAQTAGQDVAAILSALRARQFDKALQLLGPALERDPKNPQLRTLQGIAFSGQGHSAQALAAFQRALTVSPDYLPALEGAAQLEYQAGSARAVPLLNHILQLRPGDATSHAMLAVLGYKHGDCATAVQHFAAAGEVLDSQPSALRQYAACLARERQPEKATAVFQHLVAMAPSNSGDRRRLAALQLMAEHPQDALATLQPLLQNDPDSATLQVAASAYEAEQDTPNAVKALRQAIVQSPRDVDLYLDFANISMAHQSFQVGIDMINSGLRLQPKAAALYLARGVLYVQLAQYDKAEADFDSADRLDPRLSATSAAQGLMAEQKDDINSALATVRTKLRAKPNDAFLLYLQADILTRKGAQPGTPEFEQAVASARRAVSADPGLVAAHDVLAKLELQAGNNSEAIAQCRQALQHDPKDQIALYHLIVGLRKSNQRAELPELLKRLAQLRQQATREEAERNRYKLVENPTTQPASRR